MNTVLLLTSTVTPIGIDSIGNTKERLYEYLTAIEFYINHTDYHIIVVDNSGFDFYSVMSQTDKFETFSYKADTQDSKYGKGYGEAKIIKTAFNEFPSLRNADQVVKITGRHIIRNIETLLSSCRNINCVYADSDIKVSYPHSYMFAAPPKFYQDYLLKMYEEMDDSKGIHFEHIFAKCIHLWKTAGLKHKQFMLPIHIIGHPGNSTTEYKRPNIFRYFVIFAKYLIYNIISK